MKTVGTPHEIAWAEETEGLGDRRVDARCDRADEVVQSRRKSWTAFEHQVPQRSKLRQLATHQRVVVGHDDDLCVGAGGRSQLSEGQREVLGGGCEPGLDRLGTLRRYSPGADVDQREDVISSDVDADDLDVVATIAVLVACFENIEG